MENPAKKYTNKKEFYRQFKKKSNAYELWLRFMKNKNSAPGSVYILRHRPSGNRGSSAGQL